MEPIAMAVRKKGWNGSGSWKEEGKQKIPKRPGGRPKLSWKDTVR